MREAWFEIIKQTGSGNLRQRTPAQQKQADKKNRQLAERQALERELQNVTGSKDAIFDIKGRATPEKIRAKIAEENKAFRQSQSKARRDKIKQGAKRVGEAITGGAKSGWKKLLQAGKKGAKALNPNTYLPDASATSGNIVADPSEYPNLARLSQQPSRRMVLKPEEAEQREKDRQAFLAQQRKEDARQNIFQQFGEQGAELAGPKQKEQRLADARANIFEQFGQQGAELQQQNYDKQLQAGLDAEAQKEQERIEAAQKKRREELSRIADAQAKKEARDAKIKEMGEVNRQRKEAEKARREALANMQRENKIKQMMRAKKERDAQNKPPTPQQPQELMITDIQPEMTEAQLGELERTRRQNKLNAARERQAQKLNPENWKKLVAAQNPQQGENPNMPPKRQVPANAPPPKQPQPTPNQFRAGDSPLDPKRSAWAKVLQKPQAPPPKAPPKQKVKIQ